MAIERNGTTKNQNNLSVDNFQLDIDDIINNDFDLLLALILLECYETQQLKVLFFVFIKYKIKDIDQILDDSHDYENIVDYILNGFVYYINDSEKINFVSIDSFTIDTNDLTDNFIRKAIDESNESPNDKETICSYFAGIIDVYCSLQQEYNFKPQIIDNKINYQFDVSSKTRRKSVVEEIAEYAPKNIYLNLIFNKKKTLYFQKNLNNIILSNKNNLDNFYTYLSELKFINNTIHIPFDSLLNSNFDIIHTLKYLELKKKLKVKSWISIDSKNYWEIQLLSNELLSIFIPDAGLFLSNENKNRTNLIDLKINIKAKHLIINKDIVNVGKSEHQFNLLKILFEEKPTDSDLDYGEIASSIDSAYFDQSTEKQNALRKRYQNATYQLNKKIELKTKGKIKNLLKTNLKLIRFNPEYTLNFK